MVVVMSAPGRFFFLGDFLSREGKARRSHSLDALKRRGILWYIWYTRRRRPRRRLFRRLPHLIIRQYKESKEG
jgi:hypothetical protein